MFATITSELNNLGASQPLSAYAADTCTFARSVALRITAGVTFTVREGSYTVAV